MEEYYNLFGVKGADPNISRELITSGFANDYWGTVTDSLQICNSHEESIQAHTRLLMSGTSWNKGQYQHVLIIKDYASQVQALETDGYAIGPGYTKRLTDLIKEFNLTQYD